MDEKKKNDIIKDFNEVYEMATVVQKPFGEAVQEIMDKRNLSVSDAVELTGLNRNIFYTMKKPECNIEMNLVISLCIGFQLDTVSTQLLLQSAGRSFNLNNREHRAYLYLIEYYKDTDIETCNEILECLNIPNFKQLGSYERGAYKNDNK